MIRGGGVGEPRTWEERTAEIAFQVVCYGMCGFHVLLHHHYDTFTLMLFQVWVPEGEMEQGEGTADI